MLRYLYSASIFTGENIVGPIALVIDISCAHQGTHAAIIIIRLQVVSVVVLIVVVVQKVVRSSPLIFLACIKLVPLNVYDLSRLNFTSFHVFKSVNLPGEPLFTQVRPSVLNMCMLLLTNLLIGHGEILIEALLLGDEVAGGWVGVVHLGSVDIFMVTACALAQSRILNQLLIFHGSLK
jgi:hypothetical protein